MLRKFFFTTLYFLSPAILILVIFNSNSAKYSNFSYLIAMILGAMAYTWLLFEFILIARPKYIEKFFGMDKLYRFHGLMAVISITLVFIHKTLREELGGGRISIEFGENAWHLFVFIIVVALLLMVNSILLKLKPLVLFRKFVEKIKILKYEYYVVVHNLTILAAVFMFLHVLNTSSARVFLSVRIAYTVYFAIAVLFYIYHKLLKPILLNRKSFVVKEVIKESSNMWTIKFVPKKGGIFKYKPGQFGFFRIFGKGVIPSEHPFSISSDPVNKDYVSVTIKELGDFTSKIVNVKPGYKAFIDAPYGNFSYVNFPAEEEIVLIGGGVGITPILSMLRNLRSTKPEKNVVLLWGINTKSDLICANEFKEMQREMINFCFVPIMFKDDSWEGEKGIINRDKIEEILTKLGHDIYSKGYYVCGPQIMLDNTLKSLKALGVKRNRIHYEKFSL